MVDATGPSEDTRFTAESAAEAGRKSGEAKRRRKALTPEERALDAIGQKLGRLTEELLDAALGQGDFHDLKPETRVTALLRALEWRLGKAPTGPRIQPQKEEPAIPLADDLFT